MSAVSARVQKDLPPLPKGFTYRLDLSQAATPRLLKKRPRHRWFWFPHSYSPELVEAILDSWNLPRESRLLDPFVGAGTTLLVAQERGISADGVDLSPLAVRVTRVKVAHLNRDHLEDMLHAVVEHVLTAIKRSSIPPTSAEVPEKRLARAFTQVEYATLQAIRKAIWSHAVGEERDFFLLALLATARAFSRAVADGGWFRWVDRPEASPDNMILFFQTQAQGMLSDLDSRPNPLSHAWNVYQGDARCLGALPGPYNVIITSPPYPNRHDYSRVFHIELLLLGEDETSIKRLRYASIRSHVEAKAPNAHTVNEYHAPQRLQKCLDQLPAKTDKRVVRMLQGYFEDMYYVLKSARAVLAPGARLAFVVGNVRHAGVLIPVDEILADVGEQAGYRWTETWVIRLRGNSAQQMGRFGRVPSRESIVFFENPYTADAG